MMMFDNNMNNMDFQVSTNEGITGRTQINTSTDSKDVVRRVSDNATSAEDTNNMFTKVSYQNRCCPLRKLQKV